ncbi:MAG: nuclease-related domain-containing protein [Limisphaerales bacterium]
MIYVLLAAFAPMIGLIVVIIFDRAWRKKNEKPPQTEKLLRPPSHSLSLRLDKTIDAVMDNIIAACSLSAFAGACFAAFHSLIVAKAPASWLSTCLFILAAFTILSAWAAIKAFRGFKEAQNIRLGISGERAVAEALNEAADSGFRAFHDLQTDKVGNIDHVAVGTRGVFLIETKARRKRGGKTGQAAHEVLYDGEALQFPFFRDGEPIEQAKRNAAWLSNYLRNKTGEPVEVFPLVVLPGWFVKISTKGIFRVNVMSANYLPGFLQRQGEKIAPAQARRIITALDEKCRDVEF